MLRSSIRMTLVSLATMGCLTLSGCESGGSKPISQASAQNAPPPAATVADAPIPPPAAPVASGLKPLPGVKAPKISKIVKVKMTTTRGDLMIELYPEAAPNAAGRFEDLVKAGYYDGTPIFRIVPNFVAQFGINSDAKQKDWMGKKFNDDPSLFYLEPGTLAFAKAGPNTNSTQVFINYSDNTSALVPQAFSAFGKIVKGFELTPGFKRVGSPDMGLDQGRLTADTKGYIDSLPNKPDMIVKAEIVK